MNINFLSDCSLERDEILHTVSNHWKLLLLLLIIICFSVVVDAYILKVRFFFFFFCSSEVIIHAVNFSFVTSIIIISYFLYIFSLFNFFYEKFEIIMTSIMKYNGDKIRLGNFNYMQNMPNLKLLLINENDRYVFL